MVSFGICAFRHGEQPLWAKLNAKTATLAALFYDVYNAVWNLDAISV